jgi:hypothetical protein
MGRLRERARRALLLLLPISIACALPPRAPLLDEPADDRPGPFCTLRDSDAWVAATIRPQASYARVLVVDASGARARPRFVRARPIALARGAALGPEREYPVAAVFTTLQAASDASRGGDLVAVMPGRYEGFVIQARPGAGDGRYVHFKAMGKPGEVTLDAPAPADDNRWMIWVRAAHHVIVEGFELRGTATPGQMGQKGAWAGILLDGDFTRTSRLTHHVVVMGNYSHHHTRWGLHATDSRTVLIQDNVFAASAEEHSAYVSDGSDDYVIRRNVFFGSYASGLQVNLDPESCLDELLKHPAFRGHPKGHSAAWARDLMARAEALFGEHGYPDGKGENFIIEDNVINENGKRGGGALNLAGLSGSLIQNNLLYQNYAHGIAQWNNKNPYDEVYDEPGPRAPEDVKGPESLPRFGCHDNVIRSNTVLMANPRRAALQALRGSYGSVVVNNVLLNDEPVSVQIDATGIYRAAFGPNLLHDVSLSVGAEALTKLAVALPAPGRVTRAQFGAEVARYGEEPWIVLQDHWWAPNPGRPDFHPRLGSALLAGKGDPRSLPPRDLDGAPRERADLGAFVAR